jgi:hypothetical protein
MAITLPLKLVQVMLETNFTVHRDLRSPCTSARVIQSDKLALRIEK